MKVMGLIRGTSPDAILWATFGDPDVELTKALSS